MFYTTLRKHFPPLALSGHAIFSDSGFITSSDPKTNVTLMNNINSGLPHTINISEIQKMAIVESEHFSSYYDVRNHIIGSGNGINISFNIVSSALGWIRSKGV